MFCISRLPRGDRLTHSIGLYNGHKTSAGRPIGEPGPEELYVNVVCRVGLT